MKKSCFKILQIFVRIHLAFFMKVSIATVSDLARTVKLNAIV